MSGKTLFDLSYYKIIYLCAGPKAWGLKLASTPSIGTHNLAETSESWVVYPKRLDQDHVNPASLDELLNQMKGNNWLLIDRLTSVKDMVAIRDHVNRSGENWLRGKTPFRDRPQFPDMSHIYSVPSGISDGVVHTVGPKRFKSLRDAKEITSEAAGLVAPVLHYLGIQVTAVGGEKLSSLLKTHWA